MIDLDMIIRDILNKLLWDPKEERSNYSLIYIHRGAPQDVKTISCSMIETVQPSGFTYKNDEGEKIFIPLHRILEIRNFKTGQIPWKKVQKAS